MKSVLLNAFPRALARGRKVKQLRSTGRVPAVIYGGQTKPENLELIAKEMEDLIHHSLSENILVDLAVDKTKRLALVQEVQHHPLDGKVLHVDFHEVSPTEKVTVMVPVETTGEAAGVKTGGGVLEHVLFKIKVRALPKDLPEQIMVDVTSLELGKSIHLGEIKAPEGVELLGNKNAPVISVALPKTEAEEAAEAAEGTTAAAGEVEMIKEKKEDGTEGAAPAKPGDKAVAAKPGDKAAAPAKADAKAAPGDKKVAAPADKKK
jgi:large subunit ribosomal protein L25